MKHESRVVDGSIEHTSAHGIAFTARCCGDEKTDHRIHVQDAAFLDESEMLLKMEQILNEHAELHAKATGARALVEKLGSGVVGHCAACDKKDKK